MTVKIHLRYLIWLVILPLSLGACFTRNSESAASLPTDTHQTLQDTPPPQAREIDSSPETAPVASTAPAPGITPSQPGESPIQVLPINGPISSPQAEISGMAWYGETLIILPQYPHEYPSNQGSASLFTLQKSDILASLENSSPEPLSPSPLPLLNSNQVTAIPGFEGFEAVAVNGNQVYLTIEANHRGVMQGYLIQGSFQENAREISLDPETLTEIPTPVQIFNAAYESIFIATSDAVTLFEANGRDLNPSPIAYQKVQSAPDFVPLEMPGIEYRLTDATDLDSEGRFWVVNIFIPIEFWYYTRNDPIRDQFGQGITHKANFRVERLVELKYNQDKITLSGNPPLQIELSAEGNSRNWEALVRLDELGFLAMTDTYPDTILAFIPFLNRR